MFHLGCEWAAKEDMSSKSSRSKMESNQALGQAVCCHCAQQGRREAADRVAVPTPESPSSFAKAMKGLLFAGSVFAYLAQAMAIIPGFSYGTCHRVPRFLDSSVLSDSLLL